MEADELPGEELTPEEAAAIQAALIKGFVTGCIFCDKEIEETELDPAALVLIVDWKHDGRGHPSPSQQWWCHTACFIEKAGGLENLSLREDITEKLDAPTT